jgi:3-oxoacyl-[acyl-carrier-protein] synthase-3
MAEVGLVGTAHYLPEGWLPAAELSVLSGIPEEVLVGRFGISGKHLAGPEEHPSTMAVEAGRTLLQEQGVDPLDVDAVLYFGSTWKDYPVWQAAPRVKERLGCRRAFALELDYVSCGAPVALRVAKALASSDPGAGTILMVAASCESRLLDYANQRSRFMFNFGDGAVAALLTRDHPHNLVRGSSMLTDGTLSQHVKIPAGGSALPASHLTVDQRLHFLDVEDLEGMRARLGEVSLPNFVAVAKEALLRSGLTLDQVDWILPIHMKRSMHTSLLAALGSSPENSIYLEDTGHLSGADPILGLDRLARAGHLRAGQNLLLIAAGTGYTWAATVITWG